MFSGALTTAEAMQGEENVEIEDLPLDEVMDGISRMESKAKMVFAGAAHAVMPVKDDIIAAPPSREGEDSQRYGMSDSQDASRSVMSMEGSIELDSAVGEGSGFCSPLFRQDGATSKASSPVLFYDAGPERSKGGRKGRQRKADKTHELTKKELLCLSHAERNVRLAPAGTRASVEYLMQVYTRDPRVHVFNGSGLMQEESYNPQGKLSSEVYRPEAGETHTPGWPVPTDGDERRGRRTKGKKTLPEKTGRNSHSPERKALRPARLVVTVEQAQRGPNGRRVKWMDPFCTVAVGKERSRTRNVDRGEMVYSWRDEPMSVPVEADYVHSRAEIGCHERLGHYFHANIGVAVVKLNALRRGTPLPGGGWEVNEWVQMYRKGGGAVAGELLLLCRYYPEGSNGFVSVVGKRALEEAERLRGEYNAAASVLQAMVRHLRDLGFADIMFESFSEEEKREARDAAAGRHKHESDGEEAEGRGAEFWNLPSVVGWASRTVAW